MNPLLKPQGVNLKLVIALQYHASDQPQAMRLAKMIADIEPAYRNDVEFVFVHRFDLDPPSRDHPSVAAIRSKFLLHAHRTHTPWTGWPAGPNAMVMDFLQSMGTIAKDLSDKCGVLLIEPDCVPLARDWLDALMLEWRTAKGDPWIMGAWRNSGGAHGHINGNCIVVPDFYYRAGMKHCVGQHEAWDCSVVHGDMRNRWLKTKLIKNEFQSIGATPATFYDSSAGWMPVLVHGYKDDSAYNLAVKELGL